MLFDVAKERQDLTAVSGLLILIALSLGLSNLSTLLFFILLNPALPKFEPLKSKSPKVRTS